MKTENGKRMEREVNLIKAVMGRDLRISNYSRAVIISCYKKYSHEMSGLAWLNTPNCIDHFVRWCFTNPIDATKLELDNENEN